jgi:hypothetical protein
MAEAVPKVRILRHRLSITHEDPLIRSLSIEVTIHNDSDEEREDLVLREDTYRTGLRIFDADGTELALLPNQTIREILSESEGPEDSTLLDEINTRKVFLHWIVFPEDRTLRAHETRVIRLTWTENLQHSFPWGLGLRTLFNIPAYLIEATVPSLADYPHFVTVYPPPAHRIVVEEHSAKVLGSSGSRDLSEADHYHIGAFGPVLDVSLPCVSNHTVHLRTVYAVYPDRNDSIVLAVIVLGLVLLAALFFSGMVLWVADPKIYGTGIVRSALKVLVSDAVLIGTTIVALCAGFVGLASGPVFQRAKLWAMLAGAVAALGILVSSL